MLWDFAFENLVKFVVEERTDWLMIRSFWASRPKIKYFVYFMVFLVCDLKFSEFTFFRI